MAQQPQLDGGPLNIKAIRDQARKQLVDSLDSRRGKKVLVLDPKVSGPLALIAEIPLLKEHGVEQLVHLGPDAISSEVRNVIYLVRPTLQNAQAIARQVRANQEAVARQLPGSASNHLEHSVFFVPRRTTACTKILEEEGVLGDVSIGEFPLDIIPFESDVLSLELHTSLRECLLDRDTSSLFYIARAITKLEALFGTIPRVIGKGDCAFAVSELMQRLRREVGAFSLPDGAKTASRPQVDALILLDREVDLVTPMCTQLTYEGLMDEVLGIHNGAVEVEGANPQAVAGVKRTKTPLNSSDKLFSQLRDANYASACVMLHSRNTELKSGYQGLSNENKTMAEMKDYAKKLTSLPELNRHTDLAFTLKQAVDKSVFKEKLKIEQGALDGYGADSFADQLEDMMYCMEDQWTVLRLLCLLSLTQNGIPPRRFDSLRREFLLSYGHEQMLLLSALQKANLLKRQDNTRSTWPTLKGKLKLLVDDIDDSATAQDIAFTFSGYAPLSCRVVEAAVHQGFKSFEDTLKFIPGRKFDYIQGTDDHGVPTATASDGQPLVTGGMPNPGQKQPVIMVAFVGGVTFAEVSALRFIGKRAGVRIVVVTTQLVNGTSLLASFLPEALQAAMRRKAASGPI